MIIVTGARQKNVRLKNGRYFFQSYVFLSGRYGVAETMITAPDSASEISDQRQVADEK
jgi:hypothetical protein